LIDQEAHEVGMPFSLYCPVISTPLPQVFLKSSQGKRLPLYFLQISWQMNNRPIAENDANIQMSEDKRRMHIVKSRITDAGVYKCVARNPAGESSKTFEIEILGKILCFQLGS
jgi:hypothetical protein